MLQLGSAFRWKAREEHPWFVISCPRRDPNRVLLVNVSDTRKCQDRSCLIQPGEHPLITKPSCIRYDRASDLSAEALELFEENGHLILSDVVSPLLFGKLLDGAAATVRLHEEYEAAA